jgi:DNA repair ATPase RecN
MLQVSIKNFQSIEEAEIEVNGFTVIVGKSNQGKSAVCRAIAGSLYGISGTGFVSEGAQYSEVETRTPEHSIQWKKGTKTNQFIIDGKLFDKVGRELPKEIQEFGFREVVVDNKVINVQYSDQFNPIFLLNDSGSGSTLATLLTEVTRLGRINKAMTLCSRDLKRAASTLQVKTEELANATSSLESFSMGFGTVGDVEGELHKVASVIQEQSQLLKMEDALTKLTKLTARQQRLSEAPKDIPDLNLDEDISKHNRLCSIMARLARISRQLVVTVPPVPEINLDLEFCDYSNVLSLHNTLQGLTVKIGSVQKELSTAQTEVSKAESALGLIQKELGGICPVCERQWI